MRFVLLIAFVAACGGAATATDSFPAPFSGTSEVETASFNLTGGDYVVDWTATQTGTGSSCVLGVFLKEDSGTGFHDVIDAEPTTGQTLNGSANVHDVAPGRWYFDVISHCTWTLRLHR